MFVMTAPPYEWPTSTTGPSISRTWAAIRPASYAGPCSSLDSATAGMPRLCSSAITPVQDEFSANAPCTRTTVGVLSVIVLALLQ